MTLNNQITSFGSLPIEVKRNILLNLDPSDLFRFGLASRANNALVKSNEIWSKHSSEIEFQPPENLKKPQFYPLVRLHILDHISTIKAEKIELDITSNTIENIKNIIEASSTLQYWKKCIDISFDKQPILKSYGVLKPTFENMKASEIEAGFKNWLVCLQIEIVDYRIGGILYRDEEDHNRIKFIPKELNDVNDWLYKG